MTCPIYAFMVVDLLGFIHNAYYAIAFIQAAYIGLGAIFVVVAST